MADPTLCSYCNKTLHIEYTFNHPEMEDRYCINLECTHIRISQSQRNSVDGFRKIQLSSSGHLKIFQRGRESQNEDNVGKITQILKIWYGKKCTPRFKCEDENGADAYLEIRPNIKFKVQVVRGVYQEFCRRLGKENEAIHTSSPGELCDMLLETIRKKNERWLKNAQRNGPASAAILAIDITKIDFVVWQTICIEPWRKQKLQDAASEVEWHDVVLVGNDFVTGASGVENKEARCWSLK